LEDAEETHPEASSTTNVYVVDAAKEVIVVVVPDPVTVDAPGLMVSVQLPEGKPDKSTLPVAKVQVGWLMASIIGAANEPVNAFITTCADVAEQVPLSAVIVYVPAGTVTVLVEKDTPVEGEHV
jgi:C4-dicarboxylate transporter